jgi:hypothetical protein
LLAQVLIRAIARSFASAAANSVGTHSDAALLERGGAGRRSAGRISLMQGEVVQLDAIGYSEEELIAREIETHREAIALYEDKADGSDAQLSAFARQILPQLQQHLAMLEILKSEKSHAGR